MKTFQMTGIGTYDIREVPPPQLEPGHVIVRTEAAGVCGTDLHVLNDGVYIDPQSDLPVTMGHEAVGEVVLVAPDVDDVVIGDRVVVEPVLNCEKCVNCRAGLVNLCTDWTHLGFTVDGVWSEKFTVPAHRVTKISAAVPAEIATLAEPLACSLHFLALAKLRLGQSMLIIGGGPSGQLALVAARAMGAGLIALSDPHQERLDLARRLGADAVIRSREEDVVLRASQLTDGQGFDVIFEIAGSESSIASSFELAKPGGMVLLGGVCGQDHIPVNTQHIVRSEVTVQGAFASRGQMPHAVQLLERTDIDFSPIVGLTVPWTEAGTALAETAQRRDICKVVLKFDKLPTKEGR